jgi:hypothetical protein
MKARIQSFKIPLFLNQPALRGYQLESLVAIDWNRWSQSSGARTNQH